MKQEWDPRNIVELDRATARTRLRWKCPNGPDHEWETDRKSYRVCPFCGDPKSGLSVTNTLERSGSIKKWEIHPESHLLAREVRVGENVELLWKCPAGPDHVFVASAKHRTGKSQSDCPYCKYKNCSVTNSLARAHPRIARELDPVENGSLDPRRMIGGPQKIGKLVWRCPNGPDHVWVASANSRTDNGSGCPYESGGSKVSVTNSLERVDPDVAREWHPTANGDVAPRDVRVGAAEEKGKPKYYAWLCKEGHTTKSKVVNRTQVLEGDRQRGCSECNPAHGHSQIEIRVAAELALFLDIVLGDDEVDGWSHGVDIVDRSRQLIIEYDGGYHHGKDDSEARDIRKTASLTTAGWTVVRIRVAPLTLLSSEYNIAVEKPYWNPKPVADAVLVHLVSLGFELCGDLSSYLSKNSAQNRSEADARIALVFTKERRELDEFIAQLEGCLSRNPGRDLQNALVTKEGYELGKTMLQFRRKWPRLTRDDQESLMKGGFVLDSFENKFHLDIEVLKSYADSCGGKLRYPLPTEPCENKGRMLILNDWGYRIVYKRETNGVGSEARQLKQSHVDTLDSLNVGWSWSPKDYSPPKRRR